MDKTSNVSGLSAKLKQKMEEDSSQQRELILSEQEKLLNDLNRTLMQELNTTLNDIRDSLKSRLGDMAMLTAQETQTIERMAQDYLEKLNKIIRSHYSQTSKAIKSQTDPVAESLDRLTASLKEAEMATERSVKASRRRWIVGWSVGLSVFLTICAGSWGLLRYLSDQVQQNLMTIDQQNETIQHLLSQTQGVRIVQTSSGMFLILPEGAQDGYTIGDMPAIKLPTN